jgi:hypothetical protein
MRLVRTNAAGATDALFVSFAGIVRAITGPPANPPLAQRSQTLFWAGTLNAGDKVREHKATTQHNITNTTEWRTWNEAAAAWWHVHTQVCCRNIRVGLSHAKLVDAPLCMLCLSLLDSLLVHRSCRKSSSQALRPHLRIFTAMVS